jgi:hypothetical protein
MLEREDKEQIEIQKQSFQLGTCKDDVRLVGWAGRRGGWYVWEIWQEGGPQVP